MAEPLSHRRVACAGNLKKRLKTPLKSTYRNIYFIIGLPYTQTTNGWPHKMRGRFIAGTADIFKAEAAGNLLSVRSQLTFAHRTILERLPSGGVNFYERSK